MAECAVPRDRPPKCPDLTGGVEFSRTLTPRTEVAWLLPQLADGENALTDPLINDGNQVGAGSQFNSDQPAYVSSCDTDLLKVGRRPALFQNNLVKMQLSV